MTLDKAVELLTEAQGQLIIARQANLDIWVPALHRRCESLEKIIERASRRIVSSEGGPLR